MIQVKFLILKNNSKKIKAIFTYIDETKTKTKTKTVSFGANSYKDYTIYYKKNKKEATNRKIAYLARHIKNENWDKFDTAGSLARYILWNKPTIQASINDYVKKFNLILVK